MFHWVPYAMVRVALFFIAGILLGIYQPDLLLEKTTAIVVAILILLFIGFSFLKSNRTVNGIVGFFALVAVVWSGYLNVLLQTDSRRQNHVVHLNTSINYYEVVTTKYPEEKEKSWKIEARITRVKTEDGWSDQTGNVLLYFPKKEFQTPFRYGDVLIIKGSPQELTEPANPGEFNYKRFLTFRKIYHQQFVRKENVAWVSYSPPFWFMQKAIETRTWADAKLKHAVTGEREGAIASALVLGVTDGLDNELLTAYSATGAMHVLAVSGLHVGIIYWLILLLLKPLNRSNAGKWLLALTSIFILWSYAFVTGLSPSVLRAVTMFTFVALARPWRQTPNIYNTLAASAFCLLMYEPYLIMSVGFQLSFIAVIGIVYIQPLLYRWWEPTSRFLDEVWKITCVSLAAQIATFALGLLYFHQFPNYFLFSNLFVIPASFVVLIAGLVLLVFSFISPIAWLAGIILQWTIKGMNFLVFAVEALPYSLMEDIYISTLQCWALMGLVFALLLLVTGRKFVFLPLAFVFATLFSFDEWQHLAGEVNRKKLTFYRVTGHSAIDLIDNGKTIFLTDSTLRNDAERMRFHIRPNRLLSGVGSVSNETPNYRSFNGISILSWNGQIILQIQEPNAQLPKELNADWVVISNNSVRSWQQFSNRIRCKKVILDGSNSFFLAERLMKEAISIHLPVHSVLHQGAFEYTL
jgi:competence protein ComEC